MPNAKRTIHKHFSSLKAANNYLDSQRSGDEDKYLDQLFSKIATAEIAKCFVECPMFENGIYKATGNFPPLCRDCEVQKRSKEID